MWTSLNWRGKGWILLHITHITSTLNCWWPIEDGSSSTSHMSLQLSTADCQWWMGPPHHTCHFNSQLPMANGGWGSSSTLNVSLQLSITDGWWGMGPPPHHTCYFNSQQLMGWAGPPPLCTCHFYSQLSMANGGGVGPPQHFTYHFNSQLLMGNAVVVSSIFHNQSKSHHPGGGGYSSWICLSSETKLTSIAICQHSLR